MLFNSFEFAIFLPVTFFCYWILFQQKLAYRNAFLLAISYFFYGWWDWRFLTLIALSSSVDFFLGLRIDAVAEKNRKKTYLWMSMLFNLGLLCVFKYFNFFLDSFVATFTWFGADIQYSSLNIILPVGISFYTFQTMSYTIDIYREKLKPTKNVISFFAFVSFFPQLVAGPIERAANLLPQFFELKRFDGKLASDGLRQILWGFFKKIVIADNCAIFVTEIFASPSNFSGFVLIFVAILFCIQVYADFSGYSDIAIGVAKLFGFSLMINFKTPYFSKSWGEFWKRWHISLSSWILDYVFNSIAFNKRSWGTYGIVFALMVTFGLNGLWHGANWTFILFGLILGVYISVEFLTKPIRKRIKKRIGKKVNSFLGWAVTMALWAFACIIFRAENLSHAQEYLYSIYSNEIWYNSPNEILFFKRIFYLVLLISFLIGLEWFKKNEEHPLNILKKYRIMRWSFLSFIFLLIGIFLSSEETPFIYFQF